MERTYSTDTNEDVNFFTGVEVEHTPAFGKKTLFVVGLQRFQDIHTHLLGCEHIFFGANHSFNPPADYPEYWKAWEEMISNFLRRDYLCSLDIPFSAVEEFHEGGLCEFNNFIPQIRIAIPYVKLWNYNTMIKIDDKGFDATNPGVWCHSLHTLMDRNKFTDWSEYNKDQILK
jgi:hypothetical protein